MGKEYVYAITDNGKRHKIGRAKNPKKRLSQLQTGHPEKLKITDLIEVNSLGVEPLEAHFHKDLSWRKISREWFTINEEEVVTLFEFARISWLGNSEIVGVRSADEHRKDSSPEDSFHQAEGEFI